MKEILPGDGTRKEWMRRLEEERKKGRTEGWEGWGEKEEGVENMEERI